MAYIKTTWKDRLVERPNTFEVQENLDGTITLIPTHGTVTQAGTPVNATNLNKIEEGIVNLENATAAHLADMVTQTKMVTRDLTSAGSQIITFEALDTIKRLDVIAVSPWSSALKRCNGFHSINGGSYCEAYYATEKYYKLTSGIFIAIHDTSANATRATVSISGNVLTLNWAKLGTGATGETEIAIIAQTH